MASIKDKMRAQKKSEENKSKNIKNVNRLETVEHYAVGRPIRSININLLIPNEKNVRNEINDEELISLKKSIMDIGLQQNLVVYPIIIDDVEKFKILSGHRRYAAIQSLHSEYPDDPRFYTIPCMIEEIIKEEGQEEQSELEEKMKIVSTNIEIKKLSHKELLESIKICDAYYKAKENKTWREVLKATSDSLKTSQTHVYNLRKIDEDLISELHDAFFEKDEISYSTALALSKLTQEEQKSYFENFKDKLENLSVSNIQNKPKEEKKKLNGQKRGPKPGTRKDAAEINFKEDFSKLIESYEFGSRIVSATKVSQYEKSLAIIEKQLKKIEEIFS